MRQRLIVVGVLCLFAAAGCCPGGGAVLSSLTLPDAEQAAECHLKSLSSGGTVAPVETNPTLTSDQDLARFVSSFLVTSGDGTYVEGVAAGVDKAYVALYEGEKAGAETGVYAVLFDEPIGGELRSVLDSNPLVFHKGQLAAIVWTESDACRPCYERVRTHVGRVMAK